MKPGITIDTRLTYDDGGGLHLHYPWGIYQTYVHQGQRLEIERGRLPIFLMFDNPHKGWAYLIDAAGCPMYKFLYPNEPSDEYHTYKFYSSGKLYILDFRIHSLGEP